MTYHQTTNDDRFDEAPEPPEVEEREPLSALKLLQMARADVIAISPFDRGAYWILCSAIGYLLNAPVRWSTVELAQNGGRAWE